MEVTLALTVKAKAITKNQVVMSNAAKYMPVRDCLAKVYLFMLNLMVCRAPRYRHLYL